MKHHRPVLLSFLILTKLSKLLIKKEKKVKLFCQTPPIQLYSINRDFFQWFNSQFESLNRLNRTKKIWSKNILLERKISATFYCNNLSPKRKCTGDGNDSDSTRIDQFIES